MAVSIGTVYMDLRAASTHLRGDIHKAMGKTQKEFKAAGKQVAKFISGSLVAATGALTVATKQGLASVDKLAKTADKLGVATEELQALRQAGEFTAVSANTLDMAIQRMTRRIAEAAQGFGEAKGAIQELGLSAVELGTLTPDEQFRRFAEAMSEVKNQGDRVRLSMKLFDSEGVALVNTLALGRKGLEDVRKEIDEYGIAISRVDARKVELANESFTRTGAVISGLSNRIAVEFAPILDALTRKFLESAKAGSLVSRSTSGIGEKLVYLVGVGRNTIQIIKFLYTGFQLVVDGMIQIAGNFFLYLEKEFLRLQAKGGLAWASLEYSAIRFAETSIDAVKKLNKTLASVAGVIPGIDASALHAGTDAAFKSVSDRLGKARNSAETDIARYYKDLRAVSTKESNKFLVEFEKAAANSVNEGFLKLMEIQAEGLDGEDLMANIMAERDILLDEIEASIQKMSGDINPITLPMSITLESSVAELGDAPAQAVAAFRSEFERLRGELENNSISLDQFNKSIGDMKKKVQEAQQVFSSTRTNSENYQAEVARLNRLLEEGVITQDTYNRALDKTARRYDLTQKPVRAVTKATEKYNAEMRRLRELLKSGSIGQKEFNQAIVESGEEYQREIDRINERIASIQDRWNVVNRGIADSIDDMVESGKFSFKGMVDSIAKDLLKLQIKRALLGNGLGSAGGGGLLGGLLSGGRALLGFAQGGNPPVGVPSMVGEKGPELFIPKTAGTILPADTTKRFKESVSSPSMAARSISSGDSVNQIQNIETNQKAIHVTLDQTNNFEPGVTAADVAQMLRDHGVQMVDGIIDQLQRGGAFRKAFN